MADVAIIDYRIGNIPSVSRALAKAGADVRIVSKPGDLGRPDALVLPGVGHFGACIRNLADAGFTTPVLDWVEADRPLFGICVGMQMLFESSTEDPETPGLGVLGGTVRALEAPVIPHMGWNTVEAGPSARICKVVEGERTYFLHTYVAEPSDPEVVALTSDHGERFCAAVERGKLIATQFHPEKSSGVGQSLLKNWVDKL